MFLVAGLSSLSLPGLSPFVSEFLVLAGTFTTSITAAVIATLGIVLAALYILLMYQRTMTGPVRESTKNMPDLRPREIAALAPLLALIVVLGLLPEAGARRHQPDRRRASSSTSASTDPDARRSPPTTEGGVGVITLAADADVHRAGHRLRQALADADRLRRRAGRRAGRGVRARASGATSSRPCSRSAVWSPPSSRSSWSRRRLDRTAATAHFGTRRGEGAIAVDGPSLFIWGTLLVFSIDQRDAVRRARISRAASPRSPARPPRCPAPRPSARRRPRASSTPRSSRW